MTRRDTNNQVAKSVPFDNSTNGFVSTNTQDAIEELYNLAGVSASPGFNFTRSSTVSGPNAWLQNGSVPSNITGINFPLYNGELMQISVSNENVNTFDIQLYEHDGTTYTLLATVTMTAQRSKVQGFTGVNITNGRELAVQVSSGSCKNPVVQLICKGTITP